MGTLGDTAITVEDALIHTSLFCLFRSHNTGDQVQGLDVAVQKTGILGGNNLYRMVVGHIPGTKHDPQVGLDTLGEGMVPVSSTAAELPVDELVAIVHLLDHFLQNLCHLLLGAGRLDLQQSCAVVQAV